MKKGQILEGVVQKVEFPNKGIVCTEDGECVIVKNSIPGQRLSFVVNKIRKGKVEGRLLEVLCPSSLESQEACIHFGKCGGCIYQSIPYEKQLEWKENQVREILDEVVDNRFTYDFMGISKSPKTEAYRNKMEFSFGDEYKDGPLALGMHKRNSFYDLVTVSECKIVDEDFRIILRKTLEYFQKQQTPFFHRMNHVGYLRHLLVRKAAKTGEILIDLITTTQITDDAALLDGWKAELLSISEGLQGTIKGILHTKNDSIADVVKNEGTDLLYGQDYFYEELLGFRFKISPFSFFQTNSLGAEVLYETAREFIMGEDGAFLQQKVVYDLYSGTGTIAQILAPVSKQIVGVEIVEEAVEAARENAKLNQLDNCTFLAGDVLKVLDQIEEKPDFIVLDPPRDGIHPKALSKIIDYGIESMIYISCKPTSLARDLEVFFESGYIMKKVCCVDMFPHTAHVETVILLSRKNPDAIIEIDLEMSELDLTKAEAKATYEEIKQYILDKFGIKVSTLYISQVKRDYGLIERTNYNVGSGKNPVPQVTDKKREMIIDALKHFKMID